MNDQKLQQGGRSKKQDFVVFIVGLTLIVVFFAVLYYAFYHSTFRIEKVDASEYASLAPERYTAAVTSIEKQSDGDILIEGSFDTSAETEQYYIFSADRYGEGVSNTYTVALTDGETVYAIPTDLYETITDRDQMQNYCYFRALIDGQDVQQFTGYQICILYEDLDGNQLITRVLTDETIR